MLKMHLFTPFNGFNVNLNNGQKEMYFFAIERKTAILTVRIWTWKGKKYYTRIITISGLVPK